VFTARYGLIPYIKQFTFRLLKVNIDVKERGWQGMDWFDLAGGREKWPRSAERGTAPWVP
jgi:hypothetical protein